METPRSKSSLKPSRFGDVWQNGGEECISDYISSVKISNQRMQIEIKKYHSKTIRIRQTIQKQSKKINSSILSSRESPEIKTATPSAVSQLLRRRNRLRELRVQKYAELYEVQHDDKTALISELEQELPEYYSEYLRVIDLKQEVDAELEHLQKWKSYFETVTSNLHQDRKDIRTQRGEMQKLKQDTSGYRNTIMNYEEACLTELICEQPNKLPEIVEVLKSQIIDADELLDRMSERMEETKLNSRQNIEYLGSIIEELANQIKEAAIEMANEEISPYDDIIQGCPPHKIDQSLL